MTRKGTIAKGVTVEGPYSHAVAANGLVFLSGQVAYDRNTKEPVPADVAGQAHWVFANLEAALASAGLDFGDVVKCNVYLIDMTDFDAMNTVYKQYIAAPYPARTTIQVAALPMGARIEIEAVAANRKDKTA